MGFEITTEVRNKYSGVTENQWQAMKTDLAKLPEVDRRGMTDAFVLDWLQYRGLDSAKGGDGPELPPADIKGGNLSNLLAALGWSSAMAIPSPAGAIAASITSMAAEQRRQNRELAYKEAQDIALTAKSEAQDMIDKAAKVFATAVVSGVVNITGGIVSGYVSVKSSPELGKSFSQVFQGTADIISNTGKFVETRDDAKIKEKQALEEKMRAELENTRAFTQSLSEQFSKVLSTFENIQQNTNQSRAKILG
jgi:hypothetical protein